MMNNWKLNRRTQTIVRWTARLWSGFLLLIVLLMFLFPEQNAEPGPSPAPVLLSEKIELAFIGLALVGLLIGWFREGVGGAIAVFGVFGQAITFGITRNNWYQQIPVAFIFGFPAVLYLLSALQAPEQQILKSKT